MDLDKVIQKRHSTRNFKNKKPDWRDIIEAVDSMRYAPTAGNNFPLKFIIVSEPETIRKLADASQQHFVAHVHYVVVVCSSKSRPTNLYGEKSGEDYLKQEAGTAIQNFLLKIEDLGLATCWIGYFVESLVKEALKIPENINVEAFFPVGYESKSELRRKKIELENILYFEKYGRKQMVKPKSVDA